MVHGDHSSTKGMSRYSTGGCQNTEGTLVNRVNTGAHGGTLRCRGNARVQQECWEQVKYQ